MTDLIDRPIGVFDSGFGGLTVLRSLVEQLPDQRQIIVLHELAKALEAATDGQMHAAQALRDYLMEEVIA